ncbi:MAG: hypothetical protein ACRCYU_21455 [Nocardioides sp.]
MMSPPRPVKPGVLAPAWEKELYKATVGGRTAELAGIGSRYPEAAPLTATLEGFLASHEEDSSRALTLLRWAWANVGEVENHPFVRKYLGPSQITISVASGVTAALPISPERRV